MRQVLDIFDLLTDDGDEIEWKLVKASTNTPFNMEGEAESIFNKTVDVSVIVRARKQQISKGLRELEDGIVPDDWDHRKLRKARDLFKRNLNGVSSTTIEFAGIETIHVTPDLAAKAVHALEREPSSDLYSLPVGREETGSVEGVLQALGQWRNRPAIAITESRSKKQVWCRLNEELQKRFSDKAAFEDFWRNQRVIVRGRIRYDKQGDLSYVLASDLSRLETRNVPLSAITDRSFTGGLSTADYLDRFREGNLGD
jgi:hypothetical protein